MSDIVFKTKAFGGYNKKDVMDYVNALLVEKSELNKTIASFNDSNVKLEAELSEYKSKCEEMGALRSELVSEKNLNSELRSQIDFKETEFVLARDMIISSDMQTLIVGFLCDYKNVSKLLV